MLFIQERDLTNARLQMIDCQQCSTLELEVRPSAFSENFFWNVVKTIRVFEKDQQKLRKILKKKNNALINKCML